MINQAQFDKVRYYVDLGQQEGSRLVTGGEHNTDGDLGRRPVHQAGRLR